MYVAWGVAQSFTVGVGVYVIFIPPHVPPTRRTADSRSAACTLDTLVGAAVGSHRVV